MEMPPAKHRTHTSKPELFPARSNGQGGPPPGPFFCPTSETLRIRLPLRHKFLRLDSIKIDYPSYSPNVCVDSISLLLRKVFVNFPESTPPVEAHNISVVYLSKSHR